MINPNLVQIILGARANPSPQDTRQEIADYVEQLKGLNKLQILREQKKYQPKGWWYNMFTRSEMDKQKYELVCFEMQTRQAQQDLNTSENRYSA